MATPALKFTSCQAPSADPLCEALVEFVGHSMGLPTEFVADRSWKERESAFDSGDIDVCWMCGWPYTERADTSAAVDLIAAPVMADPRYLGLPVYFSDVVVRADSRFHAFADLRGGSWAYNEPKSHSGYNVVRWFLAEQNITGPFFGSAIESGSHADSIELILRGDVDAGAIDSTVLAAIGRIRPAATRSLRVIETIGPSPAPPWVMRSSLPPALRETLRRAFLTVHDSADGRAILQEAAVLRLGAVTDRDYDPSRAMAATAAAIRL
jgi:phosphonate transport system substrate-binding protein